MPHAITLASYVLTVHSRTELGPESIGAIGDPPVSLMAIAEDLCRDLVKHQVDREDTQQVIVVRDGSLKKNGNVLSGFLEGGDYGFKSRIVNRMSGVLKYPRAVDDAELLPHLFMLFVPSKGQRAILLAQRTGSRGVTTSLLQALKERFREKLPGYVLSASPLVPSEVRESVIEGRLKAVSISVMKIQRDVADYLGMGQYEEGEAVLECRLRARRGQFLELPGWAREWIDQAFGRDAGRGAIVLPDVISKDGGKLQVTMTYHGKPRTFVVAGGIEGLAPYLDISGEIRKDPAGNLDESHLCELAAEHMMNLRREIGADHA